MNERDQNNRQFHQIVSIGAMPSQCLEQMLSAIQKWASFQTASIEKVTSSFCLRDREGKDDKEKTREERREGKQTAAVGEATGTGKGGVAMCGDGNGGCGCCCCCC